jgi:outer membrane receptor protein involved in Fe transport
VLTYQRNTEDLLLFTKPFFLWTNFDNYNVGSIENKGIEIAAEVVPVRTENLEWRIGGNVTFQDSKITKLTTAQPDTPGNNVGGYEGATGNTIQNHQVGFAQFILCMSKLMTLQENQLMVFILIVTKMVISQKKISFSQTCS